jgi:predicted phage baseplate assembly protein
MGATIELDGLYEGLQPGRWLIVEGARRYNGENTGVEAAELVMIAAVAQRVLENAGVPLPGEKAHTVITLAAPLAYSYVRDTVTIYGNVVKATNGQTRQETLGAGDATQSFQTFTLKQSPLTYVSAATTSGAQSTLVSRVNDVQWHESDTLALLGPKDRKFVTKTDNAAMTSLVFGDGVHGGRLPTGVNNVTATYRSGMGKAGNVRPDQISLLSTKPLGVRAVTNPIRASGGADRESRDQARQNVPVALMALDRLVSITDYADFSRSFAGVGKAAARFLPVNGKLQPGQILPAKQQRTVQVVIAGANDIPIDPTSDLYANLYAALHKFGDPYLPIRIAVRDRSALVISANVKIGSDYDWETLEPKIRAAVLQRFSFDSVDLGDTLYLADAVATIQAVRGVHYVYIDVFDKISEAKATTSFTGRQATALGLNDRIDTGPTGLIYLTPDVPDTLVLQEVKP